jgi:very-short-patch-repair endonuclease
MTTNKARRLRKNLTDAERTVWAALRSRQFGGYKFRRQQPIGLYIVDFVCFENKLIIELDGGHHDQVEQAEYDAVRTAWLEAQGYRVLRFWNNQVLAEPNAVKAAILEGLHPHPDSTS